MNDTDNRVRNAFHKRFAIPPEKGGWVWWIGPLVIGVAAAGQVRPAFLAVTLGAFAAFCVRQPLTLWIKSWRLTSHAADRGVAMFWIAAYSSICALVAAMLVIDGNARVLLLAVPALPIFAWHFYLVAQANERRQMLRDVLASLALALSGTAAYWSCGGDDMVTAVLVWLLPGLHSSASVVHMFLRLAQRRWTDAGALSRRLRFGIFPLAHHSMNFAIAVLLYGADNLSIVGVIAFVVCFIEGMIAVVKPQVGHTPKRLGMRQLAVSTAFSLLLCGAFVSQ